MQKIKKPCSLVLSIMLVLGIIFVVIFVVFPQLGKTILMLGESIQVFIPKLELWAEDLFQNNTGIIEWIETMEFDWDKMIQGGIDFLRNGAGSVLNTTFAAAKSIVQWIDNILISAVFACYILLQKKKLTVQTKRCCMHFCQRKRLVLFLIFVH